MNEDFYLPVEHTGENCAATPYHNLAIAIVEQGAKDYILVLRRMWKQSLSIQEKRALYSEKTELERFFYSEWYELLTDIAPDVLIAGCKQAAIRQEKAQIQKQNLNRLQRTQKETTNSKEKQEE